MKPLSYIAVGKFKIFSNQIWCELCTTPYYLMFWKIHQNFAKFYRNNGSQVFFKQFIKKISTQYKHCTIKGYNHNSSPKKNYVNLLNILQFYKQLCMHVLERVYVIVIKMIIHIKYIVLWKTFKNVFCLWYYI